METFPGAPFNNPLLDPTVVRVGGRPDDLPAYPLFKTRQEKLEARMEDAPPHEPFVPVFRPTAIASEVPIYYNRNWSILNPNPLLSREFPALVVLWYWTARLMAQPLVPLETWKYVSAVGFGPTSAEGAYRPRWTYVSFWRTYWGILKRGKISRSAGRLAVSIYWTGLAYVLSLSVITAITRGLSQMDQRIVPGLATIPVLTYWAKMRNPWYYGHFWMYVFGVNVMTFIGISWVMGIPLKLGHRFRGPYHQLFKIEESPDFYLTKPGDRTVLDDPHYLRDKHMGYTEFY